MINYILAILYNTAIQVSVVIGGILVKEQFSYQSLASREEIQISAGAVMTKFCLCVQDLDDSYSWIPV